MPYVLAQKVSSTFSVLGLQIEMLDNSSFMDTMTHIVLDPDQVPASPPTSK